MVIELTLGDSARLNEIESPLLRLPAEIRNKVYAYVLSGEKSVLYTSRGVSKQWAMCLAVTSVCRQMHFEAHLLPFKLNRFCFNSREHYRDFVTKTSSKQRSVVTSIKIDLACPYRPHGARIISWGVGNLFIVGTARDLTFKAEFPRLEKVEFKIEAARIDTRVDATVRDLQDWVWKLNENGAFTYTVQEVETA